MLRPRFCHTFLTSLSKNLGSLESRGRGISLRTDAGGKVVIAIMVEIGSTTIFIVGSLGKEMCLGFFSVINFTLSTFVITKIPKKNLIFSQKGGIR